MAKKKETQEQVEQLKAAEEVEMKEQVAETPEAPAEEVKAKVEIPAMVDKILKTYPDYKELFIDNLGGVFTADTQPSLVEDAILYQNPYYNK